MALIRNQRLCFTLICQKSEGYAKCQIFAYVFVSRFVCFEIKDTLSRLILVFMIARKMDNLLRFIILCDNQIFLYLTSSFSLQYYNLDDCIIQGSFLTEINAYTLL